MGLLSRIFRKDQLELHDVTNAEQQKSEATPVQKGFQSDKKEVKCEKSTSPFLCVEENSQDK